MNAIFTKVNKNGSVTTGEKGPCLTAKPLCFARYSTFLDIVEPLHSFERKISRRKAILKNRIAPEIEEAVVAMAMEPPPMARFGSRTS